MNVAVIAVIGPVEPNLLTAWTGHYRSLGVEEFRLAFHFTEQADEAAADRVLECAVALGIQPSIISTGPWHERVNGHLRDRLRDRAKGDWHLLADADEFATFPVGLAHTLAEADRSSAEAVRGLLLDRIGAAGAFPEYPAPDLLDATFPYGAFLTHRVVRGDARKVVLARRGVAVASGNHRAPDAAYTAAAPVPVHHFKWRAGVVAELLGRLERIESGEWETFSDALEGEYRRVLDHVTAYNGRLRVVPGLRVRPVSLERTPPWWDREATAIVAGWRPPVQKDPAGISSACSSAPGTSKRA